MSLKQASANIAFGALVGAGCGPGLILALAVCLVIVLVGAPKIPIAIVPFLVVLTIVGGIGMALYLWHTARRKWALLVVATFTMVEWAAVFLLLTSTDIPPFLG